MELASQHLVHRRYFEAERICAECLRKALALRDFDRLARIVLPLQEARRQKRDLAIDAGRVLVVNGELPSEDDLQPGCYLVEPPRVGVDGRLLREAADRRGVPAVVVVREPETRDGLWPIVAVGPVTIRTKVKPPAPEEPPATRRRVGRARGSPVPKRTKSGKRPAEAAAAVAEAARKPATGAATIPAVPSPRWFLEASEALGDAAIASVPTTAHPVSQVHLYADLLEAHPNHEKLHQRLEESARAAARDPKSLRRAVPALEDEDGDDDLDRDDGQDD